jgi:hypothetical protein
MPKTVRLKREGVLPEIDDPLVMDLAEAWVKCCDELGVPGCGICPVSKKCQRLAAELEDLDHALGLTEYRQFSQKFNQLKQERDHILGMNVLVQEKESHS